MTVSILWHAEGRLHIASDSRMSFGTAGFTDVGVKVMRLPIRIRGCEPDENGVMNTLFTQTYGFSYAGSLSNAATFKHFIEDILVDVQYVDAETPLSPTTPLIQHALESDFDPDLIVQALQTLTEKGLLLHRKQRDDFVLAVSEAVNIEAVFDSTADRAENELLLHGIRGLLGNTPVIASRHYDNTGTIRSMMVQVGTVEGCMAA